MKIELSIIDDIGDKLESLSVYDVIDDILVTEPVESLVSLYTGILKSKVSQILNSDILKMFNIIITEASKWVLPP